MTDYGSSGNDNVRSRHTLGSMSSKHSGVVSEAHCGAAHSSPSMAVTSPRPDVKSSVCDVQRVLE